MNRDRKIPTFRHYFRIFMALIIFYRDRLARLNRYRLYLHSTDLIQNVHLLKFQKNIQNLPSSNSLTSPESFKSLQHFVMLSFLKN